MLQADMSEAELHKKHSDSLIYHIFVVKNTTISDILRERVVRGELRDVYVASSYILVIQY